MKFNILRNKSLRPFLLLWFTQSFSGLGSSLTSYALVVWSYQQQGKALVTAMLMVCSYAPYVLLSIFSGALSDRWNKKFTMLVCDFVAACTSVSVLILLLTGRLAIWHLYLINTINGLMNSVQSPASEVAVTQLLPEEYYQKVGGLRYFSNSLNSIMTPVIATALMAFTGIWTVITFDLVTFLVAELILLFAIKIPESVEENEAKESLFQLVRGGVTFLVKQRGIFHLILFLSGINLINAMYQAAFPAMMLSRNGGSTEVMGMVNTCIGITTLLGSLLATGLKAPKSRAITICNTLLFSMSTENFLLALGRNVWVWSFGAFLGWILIPYMSTNLDAIMRLKVPVAIQGRVFSVRNTFQFFTIPVGYFIGGFLVDRVFEPFMATRTNGELISYLFGTEKGTGAAFLFFVLGFAGLFLCLYFRHDKAIVAMAKEELGERVSVVEAQKI